MLNELDRNHLTVLSESLDRARAVLDSILASQDATENSMPNYRQYPGGPLNEAGIEEINKRFAAGQTDSRIALEMAISLTGVSKRRGIYRRSRR